ncbi:MAG: RNA polymerase sigma factor [Magnetospirillum sp. WYHS-4]
MTEDPVKTDVVTMGLSAVAGMAVCAVSRPEGIDGLERLYGDCRRSLHPVLARRLGSRADADDVLHEAFIRFMGRYLGQSIANPLALMARIAINIVRDSARMESHRRGLVDATEGSFCSGPAPPSPESELSGRQDLRRLKDAIDGLPPRCREVFLLHRVEGLPHSEVAQILGISRSAVEKHMIRAQGQLRVVLNRAGGSGVDRGGAGKT